MTEQMVSSQALSLSLASTLAACETARHAVLALLAPHQPSARAIYRVELVLEEALMNQFRHAFPDGQPDHPLQLRAEVLDDAVVLVFADAGQPFNPLERAAPVFPSRLEDATPGGLGIFLTRKYARSVNYQRNGERNELTVVLALR